MESHARTKPEAEIRRGNGREAGGGRQKGGMTGGTSSMLNTSGSKTNSKSTVDFPPTVRTLNLVLPIPRSGSGIVEVVQSEGQALSIRAGDIVTAFEQNHHTFNNQRTTYSRASRVRQQLQAYARSTADPTFPRVRNPEQPDSTGASEQLHSKYIAWLAVLNEILRESVHELPAADANNAAAIAVRTSNWARFKREVDTAILAFAPKRDKEEASEGEGPEE
ncbi:hypothetical protein C8F01DRAFT_1342725 [Mycena amicta]|nr:hypothetical protein C8F01DRAFT_1342725 [Mycena amicta]